MGRTRWSRLGGVCALALAFLLASASLTTAATIQFRCNHESSVVQPRFRDGDPVPPGGYAVDIGFMAVYSNNATFIADPTCDPLSTLAIVVDGTTDVAELHGVHTGPEPPTQVYDFSVQIGAERTDVFGARFGSESAISGFQFYFVQFGGDGTIWVMNESTGIPYADVFSSDCANGIDNRIKIHWKMNLADGILDVTVQTFGPNAVKKTFGPYPVPEPLTTEGWRACVYQVPPDTGRYYFDGVKCASISPPEFEPVGSGNRNRR